MKIKLRVDETPKSEFLWKSLTIEQIFFALVKVGILGKFF
jgi:hypothetical protein